MDHQYKYLYIVSLLLLVTGAALAVTEHLFFDCLYALGALGYGAYFLLAPRSTAILLIRRATRMGVFSAILFALSAVARFGVFDAFGQHIWVLFLILALVYMSYGNVLLYLAERKKK